MPAARPSAPPRPTPPRPSASLTAGATALATVPEPLQEWAPEELDEVRRELHGQAEALRVEIDEAESNRENLRRESGREGPGDEADAGSKTFAREHELSLANNSRELLTQVERALARIDDGSYGRCERCGEQIPKPRLQAFPKATLCVRCKQREERR